MARSRAAIHLNGDWHQAFHCWIVRRQGQEVVLQQRSLEKDTFAGLWDASAAGHWRFRESPEAAAREIVEELGLEVPFSELVYRGREVSARVFENGLTDREHHQVYVLESDLSLGSYRPDPREVTGLAAFPTEQLALLLDGELPSVAAVEAVSVEPDGRLMSATVVVTRGQVVPYSAARLRRIMGPARDH